MARDIDIGFPDLVDNKDIYEKLLDIYLELSHESFIFPDLSTDIDLTVTFTSGAIDAFGTWAEIVDSSAVPIKLSDIAAVSSIHITGLQIRTTSAANFLYVIEIGYGATVGTVTKIDVHDFGSGSKQIDSDEQRRFRPLAIAKGQKVWYRMKTEDTLNATATIVLRYHKH